MYSHSCDQSDTVDDANYFHADTRDAGISDQYIITVLGRVSATKNEIKTYVIFEKKNKKIKLFRIAGSPIVK